MTTKDEPTLRGKHPTNWLEKPSKDSGTHKPNGVVKDNVLTSISSLGRVSVHRGAIAASFKKLKQLPDWQIRTIMMMGKECTLQRKICTFSDNPDLLIRYKGLDAGGHKPFPPCVEEVRQQVQYMTGTCFNYCLLNLYENGKQAIGWHSDDLGSHEPGSPIVSVSLGAARFFDLRLKKDHKKKVRTELRNGDMLVMWPGTQENYHHSIPKQSRVLEPRISLTFRAVKSDNKKPTSAAKSSS